MVAAAFAGGPGLGPRPFGGKRAHRAVAERQGKRLALDDGFRAPAQAPVRPANQGESPPQHGPVADRIQHPRKALQPPETIGNAGTEIVKEFLQIHYKIRHNYVLPGLLKKGNFAGQG